MYLMFDHGFVDIVEDKESPAGDTLMVRARRKEDLERFMDLLAPEVPTYNNVDYPPEIVVTEDADYRYRVFLYRQEVVELITGYVMKRLDYVSFKGRLKESDPRLFEAAGEIWLPLAKMQWEAEGKVWPEDVLEAANKEE